MKHFLKISLLANLLLAGLVLWLAQRPHSIDKQSPVPVPTEAPAVTPATQPTQAHPEASASTTPAPFRWSQLESSDYRLYIANLRHIGCPEQTIREIISADVDDLYDTRRQELQRKLASGGSLGAKLTGQQALESGLRQLGAEEASVLQALLGLEPAPGQLAADASSVPSSDPPPVRHRRDIAKPPEMPIVFQPVDQQALALNDKELEVINDLRQQFLQDIGGTNQDPSDPAYLERWQSALAKSDAMMTDVLGPVRYQTYAEQIYTQRLLSQGQ